LKLLIQILVFTPHVLAADKGLRNDGAVGGGHLAVRVAVAYGSKAITVDAAKSSLSQPPSSFTDIYLTDTETKLYNQCNIMVSTPF